MEEASSIQCLFARPSRWNAGRKNFQPVPWPGSGSEKPHVWVILTVLRLKGAKHQMNSNDLRGGIEPLASFCDSVIFQVCGVDSLTKIDKISKIILRFP